MSVSATKKMTMAEKALQESEKKYRDLVNNALVGIYKTNLRGDILYVNKALWRMLEFESQEEMVGEGALTRYKNPQDRKIMLKNLKGKGRVEGFETELLTETGKTIDVLLSASLDGDIISGMIMDITERKKAEEALKLYREIFYRSNDGIAIINPEGFYLEQNPAHRKIIGYSGVELKGKTPAIHLGNETFSKIIEEQSQKGVYHGEVTSYTKLGEKKDIELSAFTITNKNGEVICYVGIKRDITERKGAEEAIRNSKELFEKVFFSQQDAIFILDSATPSKIIDCNPGVTKVFGYTRQEIVGKTTDILHIDDSSLKEFRKYLYPAIAEYGFLHLDEFQMRRKDGTVFPTEHSVVPLEDKQDQRIGWISVVRDITERKLAQEQLQSLSRRLIEAQEIERRSLASNLHDQIGQNLTALSINLNIIHSQFSESEEDDKSKKIIGRLKDSLRLVEETIERTRNVMAELRPPVIDDYGLVVALRWYIERFSERTGIVTILKEEEFLSCLPLPHETALFRIVQEVLTNVAKHAEAHQAIITLKKVDGMMQLVISDDGIGFDPAAPRPLKEEPGWGLITIEERAKALGGDVYVKSARGEGTRVIVRLPC